MKPTAIFLEIKDGRISLCVMAPETQKGYFNIENIPWNNGKSLPALRKQGAKYAKRHSIQFTDMTVPPQ